MKNNYLNFKETIMKRVVSPNSITLIGMPGSGKSSVAKLLSDKLGIKLVELDENIEKEAKLDLFGILDKYGEEKLAELEEKAILDIQFESEKSIVSTGGSVIYSNKGMEHLCNKKNTIIFLDTDYSVLKERTNNFTNRGIIFKDKTPIELYNERTRLYKKYCNFIINTGGYTPNDISEIILNSIYI